MQSFSYPETEIVHFLPYLLCYNIYLVIYVMSFNMDPRSANNTVSLLAVEVSQSQMREHRKEMSILFSIEINLLYFS